MASATATETTLLERVVEPDWDRLSPEVARFVLGLRFPDEDLARMNELATKARAGRLSEAERQELDGYVRIGNVIARWQSKARLALKRLNANP